MKTSELLDHVTGPMLDDRAAMISGAVKDELFADETVVRYLNEGERIMARDGWVIEDKDSPDVTEIELEEGKTDYDLHKSILFVKRVRLSDSDLDLKRVGYDDNRILPSAFLNEPDYWDVNAMLTETPGRPARFSTDMGSRVLRVRAAPDSTSALLSLKLVVVRLPVIAMSLQDLDKEPEIPEEFHLDLASYAAGSCLANTADIDAELRSLGRTWVKEFKQKALDAKRDKQRLQQAPPRFRFGGWVNDGSARR